jgi:hypothetical protein
VYAGNSKGRNEQQPLHKIRHEGGVFHSPLQYITESVAFKLHQYGSLVNCLTANELTKRHECIVLNVLQILGLDVCSDVIVGDMMRRGISGGQKKRVTTGEPAQY